MLRLPGPHAPRAGFGSFDSRSGRVQKDTRRSGEQMDGGELYHHLRDPFIHGLIEQPERGHYAATVRGKMLFLAAGHLAHIGPETMREAPELDIGE